MNFNRLFYWNNNIVSGFGLSDSVAGEVSRFSAVLRDAYLYAAQVELERLQVAMIRESDSYHVQASIDPRETANGTSISNYFVVSI